MGNFQSTEEDQHTEVAEEVGQDSANNPFGELDMGITASINPSPEELASMIDETGYHVTLSETSAHGITADDIQHTATTADTETEFTQTAIIDPTTEISLGYDDGIPMGSTTHSAYERSYHRPETLDDTTPRPGDPWYISNVSENLNHIYINGIRTDHASFERNVDSVNDITGRGVLALEAVHNNTQGTLSDLWNCVRGFLSPIWGAAAEPEAVQDLRDEIMNQINEDPESQVRIVAHSQGAIVASNTLFLIERDLGPERWAEVAPRLQVLSLGAGNHRWPDEIPSENIHSYAHHDDVVPFITRTLSFINFGFGAGSQVIEPVIMSAVDPLVTDPHDLEGYNIDMPHFLMHAYREDPEGLATELARTIRTGEFPDSTHEDVIRHKVSQGDVTFARAFLAEREAGLGNFESRYLEDLQGLAT